MNTQQRLNHIVDRYRKQGYQVILNPQPDDLPPFAKDFKVEIFASRPDGNVLASAKATASEFDGDTNLSEKLDLRGEN